MAPKKDGSCTRQGGGRRRKLTDQSFLVHVAAWRVRWLANGYATYVRCTRPRTKRNTFIFDFKRKKCLIFSLIFNFLTHAHMRMRVNLNTHVDRISPRVNHD